MSRVLLITNCYNKLLSHKLRAYMQEIRGIGRSTCDAVCLIRHKSVTWSGEQLGFFLAQYRGDICVPLDEAEAESERWVPFP